MTELPFEDGFFDGAYATESLEHAVEIEKAVARSAAWSSPAAASPSSIRMPSSGASLETPGMGKVVHPQGTGTPAAAAIASSVSSRSISYWEDVEPDGLFLAWLAVK